MFMSNVISSQRTEGDEAELPKGGTNFHAYVEADPINFIDPLGLEDEPPPIVVTGSRCPSGWTCYDPGVGFQTLERPFDGGGSEIVVTGSRSKPSIKRVIIRRVINVLENLAELVEPPPLRQPGETEKQCRARIAGAAPALAVTGTSGVAAGGAFLGYPRGTISGGGQGTSLISSAARSSFGKGKFSGGLGTGSVGGFIGRIVSRASVVVGAAEAGLAVGITAGARERCK